jgi:ribA/ribD-fused uncharacterized protein
METVTKVAKTATAAVGEAAGAIAETAVKTLKAVAPVIEPEGRRPTIGELNDFFENRSLRPEFYTYDPKGNLIIKEELIPTGKKRSKADIVPGVVRQTFTVPPYRPITQEERDVYEGKRIDTVRKLEEEYDTELTKLRELYDNYHNGMGDVKKEQIVAANEKIAAIDAQRHAAMYPVRQSYKISRLPITSVLLDAGYDKGKTFGDSEIIFLRRSTVPLDKLYVTEGTEIMPEAPVSNEENSNSGFESSGGGLKTSTNNTFAQQLAKDLKIILFAQPEDNEYGFLSTFYPVEFVLNGIKYFTVEQVLAAEKARLFLEDELRNRILKTRAPRSMRTMANNIVRKNIEQTGGMRAIELHEWENKVRADVLKNATLAKFKQHPDLKERLLATGDSILALSDSREKRDGTGVSINDPIAAKPQEWKGGNRYGHILMEVRSLLREEERADEEPVAGGAGTEIVRESVISGGDYTQKLELARKAAIINRVRGRAGVRFA